LPWKKTGSLEKAVRLTYGISLAEFESQWRSRTRRRYGALALLSNFAMAGLATALLVIPLYLIRRRRDRKRLTAMVEADARAEAAAAATDPLANLLDATSQETGNPPGPPEAS
jgi:hypothetical protein